MKNGFSLVELSIVLVILGLLVGGILAGQSLIHAAELRSTITDHGRYHAAMYAFRDKYFYLPGDLPNATSFWSTSTNGSGTGNFPNFTAGARVWQHLALAGIIEGNYTGTQVGSASGSCVGGTECPKSKMNNLVYLAVYLDTGSGGACSAAPYTTCRKNGILMYDGQNIDNSNGILPEDAWNIDAKLDDGKPGSGKLYGMGSGGFYNGDGWTNCATSSAGTDYVLTSTSKACRTFYTLN